MEHFFLIFLSIFLVAKWQPAPCYIFGVSYSIRELKGISYELIERRFLNTPEHIHENQNEGSTASVIEI